MKTHWLLAGILFGCLRLAWGGEELKITEAELRSLEGEYTFNASCTDEAATVKLKFRHATEREGSSDGWRADGTMHNSVHGTEVQFKGAIVSRIGEVIVVDGQFFGFELNNGTLNWTKNYERELYLKSKPKVGEGGKVKLGS
ncbi:hypothetical protein [Verrucomicrobium sp. BvORR106]|uniref:hypothetical protein n=1 Tax=Verrucomicrobium sp. BvORR106 TaxID=1403819 RepID=UPI00056F7984|nr:hypothetical protein [Verrucomicrobium sp. BvORR106]